MATEKKSKKGLIIVIFSLLLVGGGVGYYFWKKSQDEKEEKEKAEAEAKAKADANSGGGNTGGGNSGGGNSGGGNSGGGNKPTYTFPFKTEAEGNTFRAWVIAKDKTFADSIQLGATGKLNNYVQKAWDKYGVDYLKPAPTPPKPTTKVKVADLLASGINKGNFKVLYAGVSGIEIKNMDGQTTAKTIANGIVGAITSAVKVDNSIGKGYRLNFQGSGGISLYTYSYNNRPNDFYIMV